MNKHKIILTILVVFIFLFIFVNITYLNKSSISKENKELLINEIGFFEITNNNEFKKISKEDYFIEKKIYFDNINNLAGVYFLNFSTGGYKKSLNDKEINFEIGDGIYFFDIKDLQTNFFIKNNSFLIKTKSPGIFFVDTRNQSKIKIFSFDSIFDVELLDIETKEKMTSLVIYPHMYFSFNSLRNKFVKNADLLRLETVFKILYIKDFILDKNFDLNQDFLFKIYKKNDRIGINFLTKVIKNIYSLDKVNGYDINNISLIKPKTISGLHYIDRYFVLFLNKEKKIIFYKNNIIKNLNKLFEINSKNDLMIIKDNILSNLDSIRNLDEKSYNNIKDLLIYYYLLLSKINSLDYIENTLVLSEILYKSNLDKKFNIYFNSFYLSKIYDLINKGIYDNNNLQKNLLMYLNVFLSNKDLKVDKNYILLSFNNEILNELEYLSFFLKNILIYKIDYGNVKDFDNALSIMNLYFSINENINRIKNDTKRESLIIENSFIIEKIIQELRKNFFKQDLNENNLLVLSDEKTLSKDNILNLDFSLKLFFNFYQEKKGFLNSKNFIYNDIYQENIKKYQEYYLALNNYSQYIIEYDKTKSILFNTKTIQDTISLEENKLSKDKLINFLSGFEGLDLSNFNRSIIKNEYYKISKLYIMGDEFSFDLYPNKYNLIENIYRNGKKLTLSYELDSLKYDWDEMYKSASEEEKDKYDFKKFFINTFFAEEKVVNKTFKEENFDNEDKIISIFKRDKLFAEKTGEFSILKGFLDIGFNDVSVKFVNNNYDIKINKGILKLYLPKSNTQVIGLLKSDYVFSEKDHYFKNIVLKFYDVNYYNKGEELFLFGGQEFKVNKNINILDFKEEIRQIVTNIFE